MSKKIIIWKVGHKKTNSYRKPFQCAHKMDIEYVENVNKDRFSEDVEDDFISISNRLNNAQYNKMYLTYTPTF